MRLYLLRHAIAVPHGAPGYAQDAKRPLTQEGLVQAREVGAGLKRLKISPELILTSPYVRAAQTAEGVALALGKKAPVRELGALIAETDPKATSQALKEFSGCGELLLVGHEPHLSAWLAELVAGPRSLQCNFKKAGVACVEVAQVPPPTGSGVLRWLLTPKQLTLIGLAT